MRQWNSTLDCHGGRWLAAWSTHRSPSDATVIIFPQLTVDDEMIALNCTQVFIASFYSFWGARMAQWWERLPPTNMARVRLLVPVSYVGWVCCWFSSLLQEVFLRVLGFFPLLKNQHFQIPIRSGAHEHFHTRSSELLSVSWVNKLQNYMNIYSQSPLEESAWELNGVQLSVVNSKPKQFSLTNHNHHKQWNGGD